jgi:RNA polymerase sigma factor (sigma-70 family)
VTGCPGSKFQGEPSRPSDGGELSPELDPDEAASDEDEPSRLALAFRAGDRTVLAALHRELRPLMASSLAYYGDRSEALSAGLERDDLDQESWLILADLAEQWRPEVGSFGAYFRVSFPWALDRYIRLNSPSRWARRFRVLDIELPDVQEQLDHHSDADGREWYRDLAWSELLDPLNERERAVLLLHLAEQKTFTAVARALRLARPAAFRLFQRAVKRLQGSSVRVGKRDVLLDADSLNLEREGDLRELVRALHAGAGPGGWLPGRRRLMGQIGLSEQRTARLLDLLAEAGCVRERSQGRSGRLVHASPEATLAALGVHASAGC